MKCIYNITILSFFAVELDKRGWDRSLFEGGGNVNYLPKIMQSMWHVMCPRDWHQNTMKMYCRDINMH